MLSLKRTIDDLDRDQQRFRTLLDCYLAAVHGVQEHAVEVSPNTAQDLQLQLRTLCQELGEDPPIAALERSRGTLLTALADHKRLSERKLASREEDLRGIINVLGVAAETVSGHNEAHTARLRDFTTQLQVVARGSDLSRMRIELTRRVEELRSTADSMWRENHSSVSEMQAQLIEFQKRLERAETQAATDALTGLMNRGEGEDRLRKAVAGGRVVSIILIDLNGFKQVNDRWGHLAGDQVLKSFAHTLGQCVRPVDTACRWGGDEFLLMLNCNEEMARQRAEQIRLKLRITAKLVVLGKVIAVDVGASLGVAQARAGESFEDMLARADAELYGRKRTDKLRSALHSEAQQS